MPADEDDAGFDKPVEEGKTYKFNIEDLGSKGDGIARKEGFVVFIPDTKVGENVKAEVNSVGRRFAFAEVVERGVEPPEDESEEHDEAVAEPAEESAAESTEESNDQEDGDERYEEETIEEEAMAEQYPDEELGGDDEGDEDLVIDERG